MKIGIIGAGVIANKISQTLAVRWKEMLYAVASRDLSRAQDFARRNGFVRAYGSYEQLVCDPLVDIVYVATPHSHHYAHARLALEHGKAVICEKAFTANATEARALIELAQSKGLFLMEALENGWLEHPKMPHATTLRMMQIMDSLRHDWGVVYPNDTYVTQNG